MLNDNLVLSEMCINGDATFEQLNCFRFSIKPIQWFIIIFSKLEISFKSANGYPVMFSKPALQKQKTYSNSLHPSVDILLFGNILLVNDLKLIFCQNKNR